MTFQWALSESASPIKHCYNLSYFILSHPGPDRPAAGGREAGEAVGGEDAAQHDQEPRRGPPGGGREPAGQALGQLLHAGRRAAEVVRGRLRAAREVQHVLPDRDQLDGRTGECVRLSAPAGWPNWILRR